MSRDITAERSSIARTVEGLTLCDAFAETARRHPALEALRWRTPNGWEASTWSQYREQVSEVCVGLQALGFEGGAVSPAS